jgi:hypothetical protein
MKREEIGWGVFDYQVVRDGEFAFVGRGIMT